MSKAIVSFSGGATSAYMLWMMIKQGYDVAPVFANTGLEHERTLWFVNECSKAFGVDVVWLEAVVNPEKSKGTTHKIVTYETATRNHSIFESMIEAYGIPNKAYPHCNRELKLQPIKSWMRENGLIGCKTAIGIRADELGRISESADENNIFYPLVKAGVMKEDVKEWWARQPFQLGIEEIYGNCVGCWKKTDRKVFTLMQRHPEVFDFHVRMEREHGLSGHNEDGNPRVFWRQNRSTEHMIETMGKGFNPWVEGKFEYQGDLFGRPELDPLDIPNGGCSESCEPLN